MGKKLAVVGLYGMSALFRLERLPAPGETVGSKALKFEQGGKDIIRPLVRLEWERRFSLRLLLVMICMGPRHR